jgi:hypothetical protein
LASGKVLFRSEICEIIVVCPYFKGCRVAFEVVVEGFKGTDNGEEFLIVNVVVLFQWL